MKLKQSFMNWLCFVCKLQPEQETSSTHVDDLRHLLQTVAQITLNFAHIRQHSVVFNCFKGRPHRGHRNHPAAERRSQIIFFDMRSDSLSHQASADGNAAAERFRQSDNVRYDAVTCLASREKTIARAADSGLHLVVDQNDAARVAQLAQSA